MVQIEFRNRENSGNLNSAECMDIYGNIIDYVDDRIKEIVRKKDVNSFIDECEALSKYLDNSKRSYEGCYTGKNLQFVDIEGGIWSLLQSITAYGGCPRRIEPSYKERIKLIYGIEETCKKDKENKEIAISLGKSNEKPNYHIDQSCKMHCSQYLKWGNEDRENFIKKCLKVDNFSSKSFQSLIKQNNFSVTSAATSEDSVSKDKSLNQDKSVPEVTLEGSPEDTAESFEKESPEDSAREGTLTNHTPTCTVGDSTLAEDLASLVHSKADCNNPQTTTPVLSNPSNISNPDDTSEGKVSSSDASDDRSHAGNGSHENQNAILQPIASTGQEHSSNHITLDQMADRTVHLQIPRNGDILNFSNVARTFNATYSSYKTSRLNNINIKSLNKPSGERETGINREDDSSGVFQSEASSPPDDVPLKMYILISSIALVVILLIFLLIRYTSFGLLFNNKKRKQRKQIHDELNRIIYETSNFKEKRINLEYGRSEHSMYIDV
ncbi:PIR Superfamily Protein [Plasmodium ovale wallikeri]|uniref:PIR Superfamily Protein n=1 Tax=Plasmodium ovale wallikeri TaxID=864142 RepID=A0A1A8YZ88_PLAOA|nr:PIR Superfamily Protein [Plasmodium ovale wallikeri]